MHHDPRPAPQRVVKVLVAVVGDVVAQVKIVLPGRTVGLGTAAQRRARRLGQPLGHELFGWAETAVRAGDQHALTSPNLVQVVLGAGAQLVDDIAGFEPVQAHLLDVMGGAVVGDQVTEAPA